MGRIKKTLLFLKNGGALNLKKWVKAWLSRKNTDYFIIKKNIRGGNRHKALGELPAFSKNEEFSTKKK